MEVLLGKSSVNGPFSIAMLNYQRVSEHKHTYAILYQTNGVIRNQHPQETLSVEVLKEKLRRFMLHLCTSLNICKETTKAAKKMDSLQVAICLYIYILYISSNNHQFPLEKKRFVHHAIVEQTHADFTAKALQGVPQRTKWAIYPGVTAPKQKCGNPWGNQFGKKEAAKETRSENK